VFGYEYNTLTSRIRPADREWVTGYSKRKTQRRKFAIKQAEEKARKERLQERKERREEMRQKLGLDKQEEEEEELCSARYNKVNGNNTCSFKCLYCNVLNLILR